MSGQQTKRWIAALAAAGAAIALAGCGGGGGGDGVGSGGTGSSYSKGVITGFGSVIVNGVHYEDSESDVFGDDDSSARNDDLKIGMVVEIEGGEITTDADGVRRADASTIRFTSELKGPIEAIDTAAGELLVLGQVVKIDDTTVFDDSLAGGIEALRVGDLVEIYAFRNADGTYAATRIEDDEGIAGGDRFKLRGFVSDLDEAAGTFKIGNVVIVYAGVDATGIANGAEVRVEVNSTLNGDGFYVAEKVKVKSRSDDDADEAEVEGIATSVDGSEFVVNGIPVDASGVTLPDGFGPNVRVEVEGELVGGVLIASKVEVEDKDDDDDEGKGMLEVEGLIESIDTAAKTFVIRDVTISYAGDVRFDKGSEADLAEGVEVEVKGKLAADKVTLQAQRIEFED